MAGAVILALEGDVALEADGAHEQGKALPSSRGLRHPIELRERHASTQISPAKRRFVRRFAAIEQVLSGASNSLQCVIESRSNGGETRLKMKRSDSGRDRPRCGSCRDIAPIAGA